MTSTKLSKLRSLMQANNLDYYYIPSTDPHQSEYVPALWQRRAWLSGFSGSMGSMVVSRDKAYLWVDSRYYLQAEKEVDTSEIVIMKDGSPGVPSLLDWLGKQANPNNVLGFDPLLLSLNDEKQWLSSFAGISLKPVAENLVDAIWKDRPAFPAKPIVPHAIQYAGVSFEEKLADLRKEMAEQRCDLHIVSALDAIAWLFNLRGGDVECNPVAIAYALVGLNKAWIFAEVKAVTPELRSAFGSQVELLPYGDFGNILEQQCGLATRAWLDPATTTVAIRDIIPASKRVLRTSPVFIRKALKNNVELAGSRDCHVADGAAVVKTLAWLSRSIGNENITENTVATKLLEHRAVHPLFKGPSFATIAGYAANAAIVHYHPSEKAPVRLKPEGILLLDSGGQYLSGTTDITRTISLGKPTPEQRRHYTLVLRALIAISRQIFPEGTSGAQLDSVARQPLWQEGMNYGHGTGHGIGSYLDVHEGPHSLHSRRGVGTPLVPSMMLSLEPGYYVAGSHGIRLENLAEVVEVNKPNGAMPDLRFYGFAALTLCPFDKNLIDAEALSAVERQWVNTYHARVVQTLTPLLDQIDQAWLKQATQAL